MNKTMKGKIITVTSMKGGVGKTQTVLNLASMLEREKKKVLIIDLDLYTGDIAFALNLKPNGTIFNMCDDITNNRYKFDQKGLYITNYSEYISVLPSPKDPRQASKIDPRYVELILHNIANRYDVVLIDTSHVLSPYNMIAFEMSHKIVHIFTNDAFDIKSTKTFVSICKNMEVDNLVTVLNRSVDSRKDYFSMFDIKNIIGTNIDFIIPESFYIKKMDAYLMDGKAIDAWINKSKEAKRDYNKFRVIIDKLLEDETKGCDQDEKK